MGTEFSSPSFCAQFMRIKISEKKIQCKTEAENDDGNLKLLQSAHFFDQPKTTTKMMMENTEDSNDARSSSRIAVRRKAI